MNREHYWLLANALSQVPNTNLKCEVVLKLCELLKKDNSKFNTELFLDASGI
jgi:hypothetical protein